MRPKRRFPSIVLPMSAILVVAAPLWWTLAVPAVVKYPTDLDVTPRYEGSFTLFVDPDTRAPLAAPVVAPLDISRCGTGSDSPSCTCRTACWAWPP